MLDQQIIDTSGRKVVRVNDIDLSEHRSNGTVELRVTQVDVGLTGAARRLLHGVAPPGMIRGLATKLPTRLIPWEFVNLIESDPLRRVKLADHAPEIGTWMHPADLADIMEELSPVERQSIISSLDEETAAEALAELDKRLTPQLVETLDPEKAADILEEMDPDQAADVLAGLDSGKFPRRLARNARKGSPRSVRELLKFDENSAGGMMNTDFVNMLDKQPPGKKWLPGFTEKWTWTWNNSIPCSLSTRTQNFRAPSPWVACCLRRLASRWKH